MKKNTKSIIAIIMAAVLICVSFVACSKANDKEVNDVKNNVSDASNVDETENKEISSTENQSETKASVKVDETTAQSMVKQETENETTTAKTETTTKKKATNKKETTTKKKATKKAETTTKKKTTKKSSTKKKAETTTKKKVTTTKKQVKNVTPKEVQNKVNAYIKSKGITVDSSMRPSNSGWSMRISGTQESLNEGYSLKSCKEMVDSECKTFNYDLYSMYCYYESGGFYILYT